MDIKILSKDINRTNLNSNIWGKFGWFFIDSVCLSYPQKPTDKEKKQYINFFNSFEIILPCESCRSHFSQYINKYPLDEHILKSKDNLIIWILGAHNNINKLNNKKLITLDEFYSYYDNTYKMNVKKDSCKIACEIKKDCINNNSNILSIIIVGIIISISLYILRSMQTN
jgi:hypothetical protein